MSEYVALKQIDRSKLNESLKPVTTGNGSRGFFEAADRALLATPEYLRMLDQATLAGLDSVSVQSGFISGLRAAVELVGVELQFVDAQVNRRDREVWG